MERLGALDAAFLSIESDAHPMNVGTVAVFEGSFPGLDAVRSWVDARSSAVPRCRQRVRLAPLHLVRPVWVDVADFDVRRHVLPASLAGRGESSLESFVGEVMVQPFDRSLPLWRLLVLDGLPDGRWAVVALVHHCMVDGIAGTDLLSMMLDVSPEAAQGSASEWRPLPEPTARELALHTACASLASIARHSAAFLHSILRPRRLWQRSAVLASGARSLWLQPSHRRSPLTGPVGSRRQWRRTELPLADVAVVREALGGTVNDVVVAVVTRATRRLLLGRGVGVEGRTVMALVPVSLRSIDERGLLDNRVAVVHALLPVGLEDPAATYAAVRRHMDELKRSHQVETSTLVLHLGDLTPHVFARVLARGVVWAQRNIELIVTDVPGSAVPLHLCGRRMISAHPVAPLAGQIRLAVALWSYAGVLEIGLTADSDGVSDLDALAGSLSTALAELVAAVRTAR